MSEWIDFVVYALEAIGLWIVMPRWGARMGQPMMRDRNPAWFDTHPEVIASASPGSWFMKACHAWCGVSILVLLAVQFGLQPRYFLPEALDTPHWKILMATNNLLIGIGMIGYLGGVSVFLRWMRRNVPLSEHRQATLRPRKAGNYVPRWSLLLVNGLICAHLLAWLYIGVFGLYHTPRFWWAFAGMVAMTALVHVIGRVIVNRRPDYLDQVAAAGYRRVEVWLAMFLQLVLVAFGSMALYRLLYDIPFQNSGQRYSNVVFSLFFIAILFAVNRMPFRPVGNGGRPPPATHITQ
jgi:hypothetical protein